MAALLGPPEIYNPRSASHQNAPPTTTIPDPFTNLMVTNFNRNRARTRPPPAMGFTENLSPTFLSTGNPCLDFFFHVVPDTPPQTITQRLQLAWFLNPLTTLKLVCNLRGVRGTGKSDKEGFYTAALWLHANHPKTLACNVPSFADFGYFKDLPEILYRILEGSDVRKTQKEEWQKRKGIKTSTKKKKKKKKKKKNIKMGPICGSGRRGINVGRREKRKTLVPRETRVMNEMARAKAEKEKAHAVREDKRVAMAKKLVQRFGRDPDFDSSTIASPITLLSA